MVANKAGPTLVATWQDPTAWKIWSCVVMSGRHTGAVSDCTFHVPVSSVANNDCLVNALVSRPQMDITRKGFEILHWSPPPVCLADVTAHDQISVLRICILQVINDWRWEWSGNEGMCTLHPLSADGTLRVPQRKSRNVWTVA